VTPSELHVGDPVYLYEKDDQPIGRVRAVRGDELVLDLASGEECELPLEVVDSVVRHRVLLSAHRLEPDARNSLERVREAAAGPARQR
jgi:hypothetical protein